MEIAGDKSNMVDVHTSREFYISWNRQRARWKRATRETWSFRRWILRRPSAVCVHSAAQRPSDWTVSNYEWSGTNYDQCTRRRAAGPPAPFHTGSSACRPVSSPADRCHFFRWAAGRSSAAAVRCSWAARPATGWRSCTGNASRWRSTPASPVPPTPHRDCSASTLPFSFNGSLEQQHRLHSYHSLLKPILTSTNVCYIYYVRCVIIDHHDCHWFD